MAPWIIHPAPNMVLETDHSLRWLEGWVLWRHLRLIASILVSHGHVGLCSFYGSLKPPKGLPMDYSQVNSLPYCPQVFDVLYLTARVQCIPIKFHFIWTIITSFELFLILILSSLNYLYFPVLHYEWIGLSYLLYYWQKWWTEQFQRQNAVTLYPGKLVLIC